MNPSISLIKIMDKDHKKIKDLLAGFEENQEDYEKAEILFAKFKMNLEKHFYIEENAIFNHPKLEENENIQMIMKEHIEIMNLAEKIEECFVHNKKLDISKLKVLLIAHSNFEDEVFYPELEDILTLNQKNEIITKINQTIINQ